MQENMNTVIFSQQCFTYLLEEIKTRKELASFIWHSTAFTMSSNRLLM